MRKVLLLLFYSLFILSIELMQTTPIAAQSVAVSKSGEITAGTNVGVVDSDTSDPVAAGDIIDWVLSLDYVLTATDYRSTVTIDDTWNKALHMLISGSVDLPPGVSVQYSTDGGSTFSTAEPVPSSNVDYLRFLVDPAGLGSKSAIVGIPGGSTQFNAGTQGDGYKVIQSTLFPNLIFNANHHSGAGASHPERLWLDCNTRDGQLCPGWSSNDTYVNSVSGTDFGTGAVDITTSYKSEGWIDSQGRLWTPALKWDTPGTPSQSTEDAGWICADLITRKSCGFYDSGVDVLNENYGAFSGSYSLWNDMIVIGGKLYTYDVQRGDVHCFDTNTLLPCTGTNPVTGLVATSTVFDENRQLELINDRIYIMTPTQIGCMDPVTNTPCTGFPITSATSGVPNKTIFPQVNATGTVIGVCVGTDDFNSTATQAIMQCFDFTGTQTVFSTTLTGVSFGGGGHDAYYDGGTRIYVGGYVPNSSPDVNEIYCYDFATNSACAGFNWVEGAGGQNPIGIYSVSEDRFSPGCLFSVSDGGSTLIRYSGSTGAPQPADNCGNLRTSVFANPVLYYCDGNTHTLSWNSLKLSGLTDADVLANGITVNVYDSNDVLVFTFTGMPSDFPRDISSIPYSGTTTQLRAEIISTPANPISFPGTGVLEISWNGADAPQICFQTTTVDNCDFFNAAVSNSASATMAWIDGSASSQSLVSSTVQPDFTYQGDGSCSLVPVELYLFEVKKNGNAVDLKWETASEINCAYFEIEHSKNGQQFEVIGQIDGAGTTSEIQSYAFSHENPIDGDNYYRLRQVDFDGEYEYSPVRSITMTNTKPQKVTIYPNPSTGLLYIEGEKSEIVDVNLFNILGQNVTYLTETDNLNDRKITLSLTNLRCGIYYVKTKSITNIVFIKQ